MILRDPVHGLVAFEGLAERVLAPLFATREVQRLRRVRQLGLTSLVFPGAEHTRFAHAIGAAHVMVRLLARLAQVEGVLPPDRRVDEEAQADALCAAFLHDLGHGPFSHLFEEVLPGARHHEAWTADAITDPSTDVHRALAARDAGAPARVVALLAGDYRLGFLARAVSGTLDVDRCDYLLRDSHMTGVRYGIYDLDWLLRALTFGRLASGEEVLAIEGRKGLPSVEGFFLARHFMYGQVYHHKATRAAEALIRGLLLRIAELARDGRAPAGTPPALVKAARGEAMTLGEYLALDDSILLAAAAGWEHADDAVLRDLARRLATRELPKTLPLPEGDEHAARRADALARAREVVDARGLRADLTVFLDEPSDVPFEEPDDPSSPRGLFVVLRHRPIQRLGEVSFLLGQLRNARTTRPRLVFPAEARDEVIAAVEAVL